MFLININACIKRQYHACFNKQWDVYNCCTNLRNNLDQVLPTILCYCICMLHRRLHSQYCIVKRLSNFQSLCPQHLKWHWYRVHRAALVHNLKHTQLLAKSMINNQIIYTKSLRSSLLQSKTRMSYLLFNWQCFINFPTLQHFDETHDTTKKAAKEDYENPNNCFHNMPRHNWRVTDIMPDNYLFSPCIFFFWSEWLYLNLSWS